MHRFIADNALKDKEAQALITLKESFQNGNRIYSLELEELTHPTNLNRSPKSKGVEDSHHDDVGATQTTRLFENHSGIIPQTSQERVKNNNIKESANMLESKVKMQGQDLDLFSTFIENGRIREDVLNSYAKKMPDMLNQQEFLAQIPHKDKQGVQHNTNTHRKYKN